MKTTFKEFLNEMRDSDRKNQKRPPDKPKDKTEEIWSRWYSLSQAERKHLTKQHGNEFDAAWELFGDDDDVI